MSGESVVYDEPADWIVEQASHQGATLSPSTAGGLASCGTYRGAKADVLRRV